MSTAEKDRDFKRTKIANQDLAERFTALEEQMTKLLNHRPGPQRCRAPPHRSTNLPRGSCDMSRSLTQLAQRQYYALVQAYAETYGVDDACRQVRRRAEPGPGA
ncbi:hypothetical protein [Pseudomonas solani]|uniref:hypothetical protein n=1 Tax=Pseudomonas solani TaxID=2731552 RepID=UPI003D6B2ACE